MSIDYRPPVMTNGKSWDDEPWWQGKPEHEAPTEPTTFDEAASLAWSRCWAYIEARDLPPEMCHVIWPVVYGALNACATAWPTTEGEPA